MERKELDSFLTQIRAAHEALKPRERLFVASVVFGQESPTAAARKLGYRSPATSARQILDRLRVRAVMAQYVEICLALVNEVELAAAGFEL